MGYLDLQSHVNKENVMRIHTMTAAAFLCCCLGVLHAEDKPAESEVKAVRRANGTFYAALNAVFKGNLQPMKEIWSHADDVTYLGPDGSFRMGWQATLKDWEKQAARKLGGNVEPKQIRVTVGRDLAVVQNYEVGENVIDGKPTKVRIRATNLYRKEDGKWKMIGHHTDLLPFLDE
jgi:ketosteroid isomerase-like protein